MSKVAEITVSYHPEIAAEDRVKITSSKNAFTLLQTTWNQDTIALFEEFFSFVLEFLFPAVKCSCTNTVFAADLYNTYFFRAF